MGHQENNITPILVKTFRPLIEKIKKKRNKHQTVLEIFAIVYVVYKEWRYSFSLCTSLKQGGFESGSHKNDLENFFLVMMHICVVLMRKTSQ